MVLYMSPLATNGFVAGIQLTSCYQLFYIVLNYYELHTTLWSVLENKRGISLGEIDASKGGTMWLWSRA